MPNSTQHSGETEKWLSEQMLLQLEVGDIVFFSDQSGNTISNLIKRRTRRRGESPTVANHIAVVHGRGPVRHANVLEAIYPRVTVRRLWNAYSGAPVAISVARCNHLTAEDKRLMLNEATKHIGKRYGITRLLAFLLGVQRWFPYRRRSVCSNIAGWLFAVVGLHFGKEPWAADPDDIWDYVISRPDKYTWVLGPKPRLLGDDPEVKPTDARVDLVIVGSST